MKNNNFKRLNIGCGYDIKEGWCNLDCVENKGVNVIHDLDIFPYPLKSNQFEFVLVNNILEHLNNPEKVIDEIYRVSKNNGIVVINVPHFSSWGVWGDITHKRGFNSTSLNHVQRKNKGKVSLINKTDVLFEIDKKIIFTTLYKIFQPFVNIHNTTRCIYEKYFSRIFPADAVVFKLKAIKNEI